MKNLMIGATFFILSSLSWAASFGTTDTNAAACSYYQVAEQLVSSNKFSLQWASIQAKYVISSVGDATRLNTTAFPLLGGSRIGPYTLYAKIRKAGDHSDGPSDSVNPNEFPYRIIFTTVTSFLDANDEATGDPVKAASVQEKLLKIAVVKATP